MAVVIPLIALALIIFILGAVIWSMVRRPKPGDQPTQRPRYATPEEIEGYGRELRDQLDRRPFGESLARDIWQRLMRAEPDTGVIHDYHRDYCGQGLIRTASGVKLCEVEDGGGHFGKPILAWSDEDEFVAFFARQSDYSCSGWDDGEPVFFTTDSWNRNNQRITCAVLKRYLATGH